MNDEEILGRLKMIQEQLNSVQTTLDRVETRQIEVKAEIEAQPAPMQGLYGSEPRN